jgi:Hemolysin coregulated protein Hcp (TssD)
MQIVGTFTANERMYYLYFVSFEVHQTVDEVGRPSSPVQGANVYLEMELREHVDEIINWATQPNQQLDCEIVHILEDEGGMSRLKRLELHQAYCVEYLEKYTQQSLLGHAQRRATERMPSYMICLRLTAPSFRFGEAELNSF